MKKIILGIFTFLAIFSFAMSVSVVSAAKAGPQLNQLDQKDAAALAATFNVLRTLLADIGLQLANADVSQRLDKVAINAGLDVIKGGLISINGTLAALQKGAAIAESPVSPPSAAVSQLEKPLPAATQNEAPTVVMNENPQGISLTIPPAPSAENEAAPQAAQASTSLNYRNFTWPAIILIMGIAVITLLSWRKSGKEVATEALAPSAGIIINPFDKPRSSLGPVELPAESLFPPQAKVAAYSPMRSVVTPQSNALQNLAHVADTPLTPAYKPYFLVDKPGSSTPKSAVHPPAVHQRTPKNTEPKSVPHTDELTNRKPA